MQKFYSSKKDRSRGSVFHSVDKENSRHDDRNDSEQPAKESKEKRRHRDDRHSSDDAKRKKRRRSRSASRNHEKRPRRSRSAGDDVKERPRLEMNSRCAAARLRSRSACKDSCRRDQKRDRDTRLPEVNDDPRKNDNKADTRRVVKTHGKGRNTESFDPASTLVRPAMRVIVGPNRERYGVPVKHDDLIMVPNFFCQEDDWSLYYNLIAEQRKVQDKGARNSEWISWHEGAHLITKAPSGPVYQSILDKILTYFDMSARSIGTRFNWYRDSDDWKPFHHDSAAFNPERAKNQNITVGVSLGSQRELAFLHASNGTKVYFPQPNGCLFTFGRDVNIAWKHGVNALAENEKDGKGRVSLVVWGNVGNCMEEEGSPPLLTDSARGNGTFNMHHKDRKQQPCRDYAQNRCHYGNSCKFSHDR